MPKAGKAARLRIFLRRLARSRPAASAEEALALIERTLNAVEDEHTEIPFDPKAEATDGRMYPPQEDAARDVPNHADVTRYRSRRHNTYISNAGAILIEDLNKRCLLNKPGADGRKIVLSR